SSARQRCALSRSFTAPPPPEPHTLSLHDALPISGESPAHDVCRPGMGGTRHRHPAVPVPGRRSAHSWQQRADYRGQPYGEALFRSEEHTSELQSRENLVCRLLLEKKKEKNKRYKY